jgi:hypothetical protein
MNLPPPTPQGTPAPAQREWAPPATPNAPLTARSLLFETADPQLTIAAGGPEREALDRLPPALRTAALDAGRAYMSLEQRRADRFPPFGGGRGLRTAARKEAMRAVLASLDIALPDIILRGWLRHRALKAAAERTKEGGRELVELADHTIKSVHRPRITLTVDGVPLTVLSLTVDISLKLIGLTAVVEKAALVGLESGAVVATASLKVGTDVVATRSQRLDAQHAIPIDRPRPLLPDTTGDQQQQ